MQGGAEIDAPLAVAKLIACAHTWYLPPAIGGK